MIRALKRFAAFWYDFVVGDDWRVAVGVVAALAVTYLVSRASVPAWWVVPAGVAVLLPVSLARAIRGADLRGPTVATSRPDSWRRSRPG